MTIKEAVAVKNSGVALELGSKIIKGEGLEK